MSSRNSVFRLFVFRESGLRRKHLSPAVHHISVTMSEDHFLVVAVNADQFGHEGIGGISQHAVVFVCSTAGAARPVGQAAAR